MRLQNDLIFMFLRLGALALQQGQRLPRRLDDWSEDLVHLIGEERLPVFGILEAFGIVPLSRFLAV